VIHAGNIGAPKSAAKAGRNDPCPCGSGRKHKRCCGQGGRPDAVAGLTPADSEGLEALLNTGRYIEAEEAARGLLTRSPNSGQVWKALGVSLGMQGKDAVPAFEMTCKLAPDDPGAHNNLGSAMLACSRLDEAVACYRKSVEIKPDFAVAHANLGNALKRLGRVDEAVKSHWRALDLAPGDGTGYYGLGNELQALGRFDEAVESYHHALKFKPAYPEAHNNLGGAYQSLGQLDLAAASYRRALALRPDYAEGYNNLAIVLRMQRRSAEAEACCREALRLNPTLAATMALLAEIHADKGQFTEAESLFRCALAMSPELPDAWVGVAGLRKATAQDADWLADAERLADRCTTRRDEIRLRYAIGKCHDDLRQYEQAFGSYRRANDLHRRSRALYDRHLQTRATDEILRRCDRRWFDRLEIDAMRSSHPVFIVGMPRSGTTLAEQILASHPAVFGAGELPFWANLPPAAQNPDVDRGDEGSGDTILSELAREYLQSLSELSLEAQRVIDKMPENFWSLGLIHAALPDARIIHMRRNPIDTCLSIYFQHFEAGHLYANDLEDLAHYYGEYLRIMAHWRGVLPESTLLDVPYEALVADPQGWSRQMLNFIGLPWDDLCTQSHLSERPVITASKWQVRQKISNASVGRWRNYERFVGPLLRLES
jgi:tetratricopeptide (TPR) repeat protein